jgi:DNA primase catalytic core, N-terminal domain/Toprim-like
MGDHVKVDFGTLKANVLIGAVLEKYGVKYKQPNTEYLRADCPLPSHTSKESKGSFAVNLQRNIWCCKSTSCNQVAKKKGGDVLDFVALMEGAPVLTAAKKLIEWFPSTSSATLQEREAKKPVPNNCQPIGGTDKTDGPHTDPPVSATDNPSENRPLGFELKGITYHAYLEARGISKDLAERFGVGFFPGKGSMSGRIVFPLRNEKGELVGYAGRAIDSSEPKYRLPAGFHKSLVLYNRHAVKGDAVTIVEGFISCMKVSAAGFPCVALMGSTLSEAQEKLLNFKYITLLLDPDDAGSTAAAEITPRLARGHYVRIVAPHKMPDEMTAEEIKATLRVNGLCAI